MVFHRTAFLVLALIVILGGVQIAYADNRGYVLPQGRYVTGLIESVVSTRQVSESFIIQVSHDTFAPVGRAILIPKGTRLTCSSKPERGILVVECNRALLAGGRAEIYDRGESIFRGTLAFDRSAKVLPQASRITLQPVKDIYFSG